MRRRGQQGVRPGRRRARRAVQAHRQTGCGIHRPRHGEHPQVQGHRRAERRRGHAHHRQGRDREHRAARGRRVRHVRAVLGHPRPDGVHNRPRRQRGPKRREVLLRPQGHRHRALHRQQLLSGLHPAADVPHQVGHQLRRRLRQPDLRDARLSQLPRTRLQGRVLRARQEGRPVPQDPCLPRAQRPRRLLHARHPHRRRQHPGGSGLLCHRGLGGLQVHQGPPRRAHPRRLQDVQADAPRVLHPQLRRHPLEARR